MGYIERLIGRVVQGTKPATVISEATDEDFSDADKNILKNAGLKPITSSQLKGYAGAPRTAWMYDGKNIDVIVTPEDKNNKYAIDVIYYSSSDNEQYIALWFGNDAKRALKQLGKIIKKLDGPTVKTAGDFNYEVRLFNPTQQNY